MKNKIDAIHNNGFGKDYKKTILQFVKTTGIYTKTVEINNKTIGYFIEKSNILHT